MRSILLGTGAALLAMPLSSATAPGPGPQRPVQVAPSAYACTCIVSTNQVNLSPVATGVIPPAITLPPQADRNQCHTACLAASIPHLRSPIAEAAACSAGATHGSRVYSFHMSTGPSTDNWANKYVITYMLGEIERYPGSSSVQTRCPAGWLSNTSNQPGDVTYDGRCKRLAGSLTVNPLPANGTQLGAWGFSWVNEMWAYGTAANGGAAQQITVNVPPICRWKP
ncbi:MAG TPA: hypothetical protein VMS43_16520 [Allosphingosinicella sp.]|nr:hypothetical protein [Allosphingosinicella sp.]